MDLVKIYGYLDGQIQRAKDQDLKQVLQEVSQLLDPRTDVYDNARVKAILAYLRTLTVSEGLLKPNLTLHEAVDDDLLSESLHEELALGKKAGTRVTFTPPENNVLITLYGIIKEHYLFLPEWRADYRVDQNDEITSDMIKAWQQGLPPLVKVDDESEPAFTDFKRDIRIMYDSGSGKSTAEIKQSISGMVSQSSYTDEEKKLLAAWVEANGEKVNSLFSDLIMGGLLVSNPPHAFTPANTKAQKQNWLVEEGRLYFDCKLTVNALKYVDADETYLMATRVSGVKLIEDDEGYEREKKLIGKTGAADRYLPLLEFDIRIELVNDQGAIKPVVRKLRVNGYTDKLQPTGDLELMKDQALMMASDKTLKT